MKNLATALKNKIKGAGTVTYQRAPDSMQSKAPGNPVKAYRDQLARRRTAPPTMKQYGDRGYKPSTGKGVGY